MDWQYPQALYLLWLVPAWLGLAVFARARKRGAAEAFVAAQMQPRILPQNSAARFWSKAVLVSAALVCAVLALARPRWGEYMLEIRQRGCDLYILLDVSKSMLAGDVPPSRLERAKDDIKALLTRLNGERVGLIAFAGRPAVRCPLTSDYGFFRLALDETDTFSAPRGGTAIGDAIRKALEVLPKEGDRDQVLLLITDGEDHESYPLDAADAAAERKVAIVTVGLGDAAQGARVPVKAGGTWLNKDGQQIWSKLDTNLLDQIARRTNGAFVPVGTKAYDLGQIYVDHLAKLRGDGGTELKRKRLQERFQIFLGIALLLLLVDLFVMPYAPRPVVPKARAIEQPRLAAKTSSVIVGMLLAALAFAAPVKAEEAPAKTAKSEAPLAKEAQETKPLGLPKEVEPGKDAPSLVAEGLELYRKQEYAGAGEKFAAAETRTLENEKATVAFNLGAALQRKGDKDGSLASYEEAGRARDKRIATAARFNMGCVESDEAKKLAGEHPEELAADKRQPVIDAMGRAVKHFRECLDLDAGHEGARRNLELLREWVKYYSELWRKKDQQKRRDDMDLLAFLEYLIQTQDALKVASEKLAETPNAPIDAFAEVKRGQDELAEEIPALKDKIEKSAKPPQQPGSPPSQPDPEMEKAVNQLKDWADQSKHEMTKASEQLDARVAAQAALAQEAASDLLGKIWEAVAPFRKLLAHDLEKQTQIVQLLTPNQGGTTAPAAPLLDKELQKETETLAKLQERTGRRTKIMGERARMELEQLEQAPPQQPQAPQPGQPQPPDPEKVKEGLKKAVELAPKAVEHQEAALRALRKADRIAAFPEAEEARKILEEIAKAQPQDPNKDQDKQDQKKDQQKDQQQDQKKDQDKQDKKNQGDKKSEEKSQDSKDEKSKDPNKKTDEQEDKNQPKPEPKQMTQQQAEALLRKVQERERERRRKLEEFKVLMGGQEPVDKDW